MERRDAGRPSPNVWSGPEREPHGIGDGRSGKIGSSRSRGRAAKAHVGKNEETAVFELDPRPFQERAPRGTAVSSI